MSLSIASPDSSLYLCDKACFRNYIMKPSNPVSYSFAQIAKWIIDGMAAMHSLTPRSTYMEPANINAHSLDIIMDKNKHRSVKEGNRTQSNVAR